MCAGNFYYIAKENDMTLEEEDELCEVWLASTFPVSQPPMSEHFRVSLRGP